MLNDNKNVCPMTPEQVKVMLDNQVKLMQQMANIEKYLFAGRVTIGVIVSIALTLDWFRDHASIVKSWFAHD